MSLRSSPMNQASDGQWTGPSAVTDSLATDLLAGEYFVTVTNEAGCQDSSSAILSDPVGWPFLVLIAKECVRPTFIVADAAGGTGELTYEWLDQTACCSRRVRLSGGHRWGCLHLPGC